MTLALVADAGAEPAALLLCFSHLRWDFVFQRPQHLMTRFSRRFPVLFWEEPVIGGAAAPFLKIDAHEDGRLQVATPYLPAGLGEAAADAAVATLLQERLAGERLPIIRWYYTPMMLRFSGEVEAACTVYDCMDELSAFKFAPPELLELEQALLVSSDLVFTGGHSLYEAKRERHADVRPFPSSVDVSHFARARTREPGRGRTPRLGFYGVIDERMDLDLIAHLADARPDWCIEIVGPVVKIDPALLPRRPNLHYPGARLYNELPMTIAGWDVALMPFAINQSTRFISPTKTPEYLAAGRPVVSTPIVDVVRHYGALEAVRIADSPARFLEACDEALALVRDGRAWRDEADEVLAATSWDKTAAAMLAVVDEVTAARTRLAVDAVRLRYDYLAVGATSRGR